MQTIKFYIKISAIALGLFFAGSSFAASPYYVNNPALCPTDAFSQSCVGGLEVCGVNPSNVVSCYDTNTFSPPAAQGSTSSNTATTTGGYYIDCYGYDTAAPYCNNNGSFYCMQNSSCNSLQKVTLCTAGVWAASTCGTCKAGYNDCDGNSVNGCSGATEHDGVACVTSLSLPGTWQNCVCVGSVLKLGSDSVSGTTGVVQGGAASVFFINGLNVGIGSSAPNDTFSIANAGVAPAGSSATGHNYTSTYLSSDDYALANYGVVKTLIASATSTLAALWGGTLNGNIWNGAAGAGNVGIGTTAPGSKLSIVDTGIANTPATLLQGFNNIPYATGNGVGAARLELGHGILHGYIESGSVSETDSSSGYLAFGTRQPVNSVLEAMRINTAGNVGIGTTNPTYKLDINTPSGVTNFLQITGNGVAAANGFFKVSNYTGAAGVISPVFWSKGNTSYPGVSFIGDTTTDSGSTAIVEFIARQNNATVATRPLFSFQNYTNTAVAMQILASGNVGIGATAPNDIFSISNSSGAAAPAGSDRTGHNYTSTYLSSDNYALANYGIVKSLISDATSSLPTITNYWSGTKNGAIWNGDAGAGNVGIGTTTPIDKFQVYGNSFLGKISGYPFKSLWSWESDHSGYYSGVGYQDVSANNKKLYTWWVDNVVETNINSIVNIATPGHTFDGTAPNNGRVIGARIMSSGSSYFNGGNVGIGTTNPVGTISGRTLQLESATTYTQMYANSTGANYGSFFTQANNTSQKLEFGTFGSTNALAALFGVARANNSFIYTYSGGALSIGTQGSQNLTLGTNNVANVTIQSGGNVGIGTTLPGAPLDVNGTIRGGTSSVQGSLILAGNYSANQYVNTFGGHYSSAGTVIGYAVRPKPLASGYVSSADNIAWYRAAMNLDGGFHLFTGGSQSVAIGSDVAMTEKLTVLNSGNVGINTVAPNDIFSIGNAGAAPAGSSNTGHNYTNTYLSSDDYALANYGLVKTLISAATSSSALWGGTTGGNIWSLNSANVGIGTTTPDTKLSVSGSIRSGAIIINSSSGLTMYDANGYGGGSISSSYGYNNGDVYIRPGNASGTTAMFSPNGGLRVGLDFAARPPVDGMIVKGNVGIGTTTPSEKLDISSTVAGGSTLRLYVDLASYGDRGVIKFNGRTAGGGNANTAMAQIVGGHTDTGTTNYLDFKVGAWNNNDTIGSTMMRINSSGNVGIGTTNPIYRLDVSSASGSGAARITSAQAWTDLYLYNSGGYGIIETAGNRINLWSGNTNTMTLFSGNVGIGTTAPNDSFSIGNAGAAPAGSSNTGHNYTSTYLSADNYALANYGVVKTLIAAATSTMPTGANFWGGTLNGNIWNGAAGAGNVGIGTTNPGLFKLNVLGNVNVDGDQYVSGNLWATSVGSNGEDISLSLKGWSNSINLYDGEIDYTANKHLFNAAENTNSFSVYSSANDNNQIRVDGFNDYVVLSETTGRVGIGAGTPKLKLEVNGTSGAPLNTGTAQNGALRLAVNDGGLQVLDMGLYTVNGAGWLQVSHSANLSNHYPLALQPIGGSVGIGTSNPQDIFSIGNGGASAPAGSSATGHNYTNTYLSSDDYALANYGIVKTLIAAATSTITSNNSWNKGGNTLTQTELFGTLSNHPLPFVVNSTEVMRLQANGSVSIGGGTSTTVRLHVASPQNAVALFTSTINAGLYSGYLGNGNYYSGEEFGLYETLSGTSLATYDYQNSLVRYGDSIVLDSFNNVGIGTSIPNDTLSIGNGGASAPAGSSATGHNYTNTYLSSDDYALANYGIVKTLIAAATSTMPTGANFWGGTLNGNIWNGAAGAGNVGIGTTNPTQKLTVSGNALIDGGNMLYLRDTSTYINEGSGLNIVAGNTRSINLAGGTGTDMTITSAGNVGIGTSTALSKLDVQSNTGKQANFFGYSEVSSVSKAYNYNGSIMLGNVAAYQGIIDYFGAGTPATLTIKNTYAAYTTNSRINFDIGANNIMSVQGSGNVGIGTTTPNAKLHVYTNGTNIFRNEAGGTAGYNYFDMAREYNYRTNAIRFITNGTQNWSLGTLYNGGSANSLFSISSDDNFANSKFLINASGNIGIGTTAPNDIFSIGNAGSAPAGSSNTGHNFTSTYLNNDDYALTNYGLVKSMISATGGLAVYATSTPATYAGNVGGYTAANALCSAVISGSHICTSEEMLNTVNKGQAGNIPLNSMLWINNGPPAFTANANDCIGWTSNASNSYSAQWNRPTGYTDGFGSLNNCNIPRQFACCQ